MGGISKKPISYDIQRERRLVKLEAELHNGRPKLHANMIKRGRLVANDPNIIGAHEVDPVCCIRCGTPVPWHIVKGWR